MGGMTEIGQDGVEPQGEAELAVIIGTNLRRLRGEHKFTLEALARISGVSKSMLGEIELGRTTPNISLLWRVAQALGTTVSVFLQRPSTPDIQIFRCGEMPPSAAFHSRLLGPSSQSRVRFHQMILAPGCEEGAESHPAGTMANLVVGSGVLSVRVGAESMRLGVGDAAYFPATLPHVYHNPGEDTAIAYRVTMFPVQLNFV